MSAGYRVGTIVERLRLLPGIPWAMESADEIERLSAENVALRELIDQINAKIGHFAGKPVAEGMPILGIIVDIANIAAGRKG